jgi:P27 family predicted phage terminase small subunit
MTVPKKPAHPPAPERLSAEAKSWWAKIVSEYDLDDASLLILESALESFDRMRQAQALLKKEGIVVKDRFGQPKQHPATLIERDSKAMLLRQVKALGLDLEPLNDMPGRPPGSLNRK